MLQKKGVLILILQQLKVTLDKGRSEEMKPESLGQLPGDGAGAGLGPAPNAEKSWRCSRFPNIPGAGRSQAVEQVLNLTAAPTEEGDEDLFCQEGQGWGWRHPLQQASDSDGSRAGARGEPGGLLPPPS